MRRQFNTFAFIAAAAGLLSGCALFRSPPMETPAKCPVCKNNIHVELLYAPAALPNGSQARVIEPSMQSRDPRTSQMMNLNALGADRVAVCNACGLIVGADEQAVSVQPQHR